MNKLAMALVLLLATTAACGSSGSGDGIPPQIAGALNSVEEGLAGTYDLKEFTLLEAGSQPTCEDSFGSFEGRLVLQSDRYAELSMRFCDESGAAQHECRRTFVWGADVGWIHLYASQDDQPNVEMRWTEESGGILVTEPRVPDNRPDCALLLIEQGRELLHWVSAD